MVLHEKDDHAVGELEALRLRQLDLMERRSVDLAIRARNLRHRRGNRHERCDGNRPCGSHWASPLGAATVFVDSMAPTVRFVGTNGELATRRTSAGVTLSISSTSRNN